MYDEYFAGDVCFTFIMSIRRAFVVRNVQFFVIVWVLV